MSIVIHKSLIVAEHDEERDNIEENEAGKMDEGRRKKTGAYDESLVCRPATARKSASEGDESREATEAFEDTFKEMKKKFVMMKMLKKTSL